MGHKLKNGAEAHALTKEDQALGGKQKGINNKIKKTFAQILTDELSTPMTVNGVEVPKKQAMMMVLVRKALQGKLSDRDFLEACKFIRDTIGEKPIEKMMLAEVEQSVIDEVERMVLGDDEK